MFFAILPARVKTINDNNNCYRRICYDGYECSGLAGVK